MQSSQYAVLQHGVLTASRRIRLSIGQTMLGSFEGRSRTSASERPLDLTDCLCHDALREPCESIRRRNRASIYSRVWLGDNVATFGRDHNSLAYLCTTWIVDGLQEAPRNTCHPFYARFIVELTITIRWTILNPMASHAQGKSDTPSVMRLKYRTYLSAHNGSTRS